MTLNTLLIDTSNNEHIKVGLKSGSGDIIYWHKRKIDYRRAQIVLPLIDSLLAKKHLILQDIHGIEVVTGPGSFTGIRVGVSVANALGFALRIAVNGKKKILKLN